MGISFIGIGKVLLESSLELVSLVLSDGVALEHLLDESNASVEDSVVERVEAWTLHTADIFLMRLQQQILDGKLELNSDVRVGLSYIFV